MECGSHGCVREKKCEWSVGATSEREKKNDTWQPCIKVNFRNEEKKKIECGYK